jgi:hypothetical protein
MELLAPTDEEQAELRKVVGLVEEAAIAASKGRPWSVAHVTPVGSSERKTGLRFG